MGSGQQWLQQWLSALCGGPVGLCDVPCTTDTDTDRQATAEKNKSSQQPLEAWVCPVLHAQPCFSNAWYMSLSQGVA